MLKARLFPVQGGEIAFELLAYSFELNGLRLVLLHVEQGEEGALAVGPGGGQSRVEDFVVPAGRPYRGRRPCVPGPGQVKVLRRSRGHAEIKRVGVIYGETRQGFAQRRGDMRIVAPDVRLFKDVLQGGPFGLDGEGRGQVVGQGHAGAAVEDEEGLAVRVGAWGEFERQAQVGPVAVRGQDFAVAEPLAEPHGHGRSGLRVDRLDRGEK